MVTDKVKEHGCEGERESYNSNTFLCLPPLSFSYVLLDEVKGTSPISSNSGVVKNTMLLG